MKIESIIKPSINTIININIHKRLLVQEKLQYTLCVIPATIEEKINIDIQFETHFSVISSHSRISNTQPTVIAMAANNRVVGHVSITLPHNK
jgi:hypothetical protein